MILRLLSYDLAAWDDTLPPGEGVGTIVGEEEVTAWRPEGYVWQRRVVVRDPVPALDTPRRSAFGELNAEVSQSWRVEADGARVPALFGHVPAQAVDLHVLGLVPLEPDAPDAEALVSVTTLAPFAVQVDRRIGYTVPVDIAVPVDRLAATEGTEVVFGEGERGLVLGPADGGGMLVRSLVERVDPTPLPNPEDLDAPVGGVALAGGALLLVARILRGRRSG